MITATDWWESHFDEFVSDLSRIISIPSVSRLDKSSGEEPFGKPCREVLEAIGELSRRYGFDFVNDSDYYGLLVWKGELEETMGLYSHLDVVPAGTGWKYPPFELTRLSDKLVGRGTGDDKGPAVTVLYALRYLKETGFKPRHTIIQFFGVNEECGMEDIDFYARRNPAPAFGLVPDAVFPVSYGEKGILELDIMRPIPDDSLIVSWASGTASNAVPGLAEAVVKLDAGKLKKAVTDTRVEVEEIGSGVKVTAHGTAAHAARPEGGVSAENLLLRALLSSGLFPEGDEALFNAVLSLFSDANGAGLGVPYEDEVSGKLTHVGGMARLEDGVFRQNINIRYTITADYPAMMETIKKTLSAAGFTLETASNSAPMYAGKDLPVIAKLAAIANEELGTSLEPFVMGGGTYARHLKNTVSFGCTIPGEEGAFGPGRGGAHQVDEYVSLRELEATFRIYARAVPEVEEFLNSVR